MATSTITNTTTDLTGAVAPNVSVTIRLYANGSRVGGFRISDSSEVLGVITTSSNSSGVWTVALERNANITPAGTYYVAEESYTAAQGGPKTWAFSVGNSNTTLDASLVDPLPASTTSGYLTQATADARYEAIGTGASNLHLVSVLDTPGVDNTGATDSTTAIQTAINATPAGYALYFPPGIYLFSTLTVSSPITILGQGWSAKRDNLLAFGNAGYGTASNFGGAILRSTATSGAAITIVSGYTGQGDLRDFALIGPGSGTSTGIKMGTAGVQAVVEGEWSNILVGNFATGIADAETNDFHFKEVRVIGCTTGWARTSNCNNNSAYDCSVQRCVTGLTHDGTCEANSYYGPLFQNNTGVSCKLNGRANHLFNPWFENSGGSLAVQVVDGVFHAIHGGEFNSSTDKIQIDVSASDTTLYNIDYVNSGASLINHGTRTISIGKVVLTSDDGTDTLFIDNSGGAGKVGIIVNALQLASNSGNQAATFTTSAGTPEGSVTAAPGSYCADKTNGEGYIKHTGTGNTGWKLVTHA